MERTVERLLGELTGHDVRVTERTELEGGAFAPVARLTLDREYAGIGRTVIAKGHRPTRGGWGSGAEFLRKEQHALEHLRGTGLAPSFSRARTVS